MLVDKNHIFTHEEITHMINRVNYLKVKLNNWIEPTVFEKTIHNLQQNTLETNHITWIDECIKDLCTMLIQKTPNFVEKLVWARKIDGSQFSPKELFDMAKSIITIKHKKDILNIFSPGELFSTQYGLELEQALYTAFPDLEIPDRICIKITFNGIETDRKTHPSKKSWLNPSKTIRFEHTQFGSYEEAARRIINLLDNESFIEHNMKYMSWSYRRLDINSINIWINIDKFIGITDKDDRSFETRESIVHKIKKMYNFIDSQASINNEGKAFDLVCDTIQEIKESKNFNDIQKEYIFKKTRWMLINTLVDNGSTLYIWYWNINKLWPQADLYTKYNILHNILKHIENNKDKDAVYTYVDHLLSLLEKDEYYDFNYDNYKPWYLASKQKSVINACRILKMIKKTKSLQEF